MNIPEEEPYIVGCGFMVVVFHPESILSVHCVLCAFTNTLLATSGVRELGQVMEHTCNSVGYKVAFRFWWLK